MNVQTLKFRLIALSIVLIALASGTRYFLALPFMQEQFRDQIEERQLSIASYVARDVERNIAERKQLAGYLSEHIPLTLLDRPRELSNWLEERQQLTLLFDAGLTVLDGSGRVLAAGSSTPVLPPDFDAGPEWSETLRSVGGAIVSRPFSAGPKGEAMLVVTAPILDAKGGLIAAVSGAARLDSPFFLQPLQERRVGESGGLLVISPEDGVYVGASDPGLVMKALPAPGAHALFDRAVPGFRGADIVINERGQEELAAMVGVPDSAWFVVARMAADEAFGTFRKLGGFVIQGTAITLFIVIAALLFLLPRVLRPLTDTARAMREMADGRRELAALPVRRSDEVGNVVLGFNHLLDRLREQEEALRKSEAHMSFLAHHDSLTGVCNRQMLEKRLDAAMKKADGERSSFALLFCDLDCLKTINDVHGHGAGDAVLIQVAQRLSQGRGPGDTVARLGGDEFVVLLTDLHEPRDDALRQARACLAGISDPCRVGEKSLALNASIGIALYNGGGSPISGAQLIMQADSAMYQVKKSGKNGICFAGDGGGILLEGSHGPMAVNG